MSLLEERSSEASSELSRERHLSLPGGSIAKTQMKRERSGATTFKTKRSEEPVWRAWRLPGGFYILAPLFSRQRLRSEMWQRGAAHVPFFLLHKVKCASEPAACYSSSPSSSFLFLSASETNSPVSSRANIVVLHCRKKEEEKMKKQDLRDDSETVQRTELEVTARVKL